MRTPIYLATFIAIAILAPIGRAAETSLRLCGADRMVPVMQSVAKSFMDKNPDTKIEIQGAGQQIGSNELSSGKCDIIMLDRPIDPEEYQRIRRGLKAEPVAVPVAMDAVMILVHPTNPLDSLTLDQLSDIWTHKVNQWIELGVLQKDKEIRRFGLKPEAGARAIMQSAAMHNHGFTSAIQTKFASADVDNEVARDQLTIGFAEMIIKPTTKVLPMRKSKDAPPVAPTRQTIQSRDYPLSNYLYLCFPGQPTGPARDLLSFTLSNEGQKLIADSNTGVISLPFTDAKNSQ